MEYFFGWYICSNNDQINDSYTWCCDTFGIPNPNTRWVCELSSGRFYFKQQKDANWFLMKWS